MPAFEVTDTRLDRPLSEGPTSSTVLSRGELNRSGRTNLSDLLRELPEFPNAYINDNVAISGTRGGNAADLRGLGAGNTLVLVNGRRTTVSADPSDTTVFVDLNRYPPGLLERVEILKGGASAIHGADAVGGVINLITRRRPDGGELRVSYGNTFDTDASELNMTAITGATQGQLGVSVSADFMERHALANRDRWFSRTANLVPRFLASYDYFAKLSSGDIAGYDGRSLTAPNARLVLVPGQVNGQNGVNIPGLAAGTTITFLPGTGGAASGTLSQATPSFTAPATGTTAGQFNAENAATFVAPELTRGDPAARNLFNFNDYIWLVPEAARAGGNLRLDWQAAAGPYVFAEAGGQHNRSHTEFHPVGTSALVPRTNPYNPFGVDVTAAWRIAEAGPRQSQVVDDSSSSLLGIRSADHASITWETAISYSRDSFTDTTTNAMNATRTLAALASTNPATALNPFGGAGYRNDPALIASLKTTPWFGGRADLLMFDAQVAGVIGRTTAGPIRLAGYLEKRRERFSSVSDAESQAGDVLGQGQTGADVDWSRIVNAASAEIRVPLVGPPGGDGAPSRLSFEAAARLESVAGAFHSGAKPSLGLVAQPIPSLQLRLSHAWTFRAPTLPQLYAPQSDGFYNSVLDPRRPVALTGDLNDGPNVSRLVRSGGNPALTPETGRVLQAGAVWEPHHVSGLTIETTWYRYKIENIITGVGPDYVLQNELGGLGALVQRAPGSETYVNTSGSPIKVLTGPNGQTTLVAPGATATVPGRLTRIDSYIVNLSRRRLLGSDYAVRYVIGNPAQQRWILGAAASYTESASTAYDHYSPLVSYTGFAGSPRWRGRSTVDWDHQALSLGTTFTYTASSGSHEDGSYEKPYRLVNLRAGYTTVHNSWLHGAQVSVGLDDLFNETPPLYNDPPIGYSHGAIARPQGRFWRMELKQSW